MPHIHTQPDQHDMTVSAYIVRLDSNGQWRCLVHMHRKIGKLMQVGGHIELNETPWQAMRQELADETGYSLDELQVLQVLPHPDINGAVVHPVPLLLNTHGAGQGHFHSDICYGLVARAEPRQTVAAGESADIRWYSLSELRTQVAQETALQDVADIYGFLLMHIDQLRQVPAAQFSLGKPANNITYLA